MTAKTDRELLELAAKAAGLTVLTWNTKIPALLLTGPTAWNPLADDGDALRLAVKLGLGISIPLANKRTDVVCFSHSSVSAIESHGDPYAATRRAIVRAAAAIGETL